MAKIPSVKKSNYYHVGVGSWPSTGHNLLILVNPDERVFTPNNFIMGFVSGINLRVWATCLDDALDTCVDWIVSNAPGLLADDEVTDEYNRLVALGNGEDEAMQQATQDTTCAGNAGNYLHSWEWRVIYANPTRGSELIFF